MVRAGPGYPGGKNHHQGQSPHTALLGHTRKTGG
jgi:hypothetical protein